MASDVWSRSNIFIQHFASRANVWSFSHLCKKKQAQAGKSKQLIRDPIRLRICVTSLHNFSGNTEKAFILCGLTLFDVWSNIVCSFSHPMLSATNTMLDENVWSFSRGLILVSVLQYCISILVLAVSSSSTNNSSRGRRNSSSTVTWAAVIYYFIGRFLRPLWRQARKKLSS